MEKINIAELLKDYPQGMELDCTMYDNVTLLSVSTEGDYPIKIVTKSGFSTRLTKYGQNVTIEDAKCVIFPKGKTTWEGFNPYYQFKNGDVVATRTGMWIGITTGGKSGELMPTYCVIKGDGTFEAYLDVKNTWCFSRLATEEEKQKLFNAIKANGYKWNAETKTLEKLIESKFKVGDRIKDKNNKIWFVVQVSDKHFDISLIPNAEGYFVPIEDQDNYELVPNKFNINTLKPFDKVLVRDCNVQEWLITFFSHCNGLEKYKYSCINGTGYAQCIPYESNEHLRGKTDDCQDFYKTWE